MNTKPSAEASVSNSSSLPSSVSLKPGGLPALSAHSWRSSSARDRGYGRMGGEQDFVWVFSTSKPQPCYDTSNTSELIHYMEALKALFRLTKDSFQRAGIFNPKP